MEVISFEIKGAVITVFLEGVKNPLILSLKKFTDWVETESPISNAPILQHDEEFSQMPEDVAAFEEYKTLIQLQEYVTVHQKTNKHGYKR